MIETSPIGYATIKLTLNHQGLPIDYVYVEINRSFEHLTGLSANGLIGHQGSQVQGNIDMNLIEFFNTTPSEILMSEVHVIHLDPQVFKQITQMNVYALKQGFLTIEVEKTSNIIDDGHEITFESFPIAMASVSLDGKINQVNHLFCHLLGYTKDEVSGRWFGDFIAPSYVDKFEKRFQQFIDEGVIYVEFELLHKNGSSVNIRLDGKVALDDSGSFLQANCLLKDTTIQHQLEVELTENRRLIKSLMDITPDVIYIKNILGKYLLFNKAAEKVSGKKASDVLGKGVDAAYPRHVAQRLTARDKEIYDHKKVIHTEESVVDSSGNLKMYSSTKGPIFDEAQEVIGMFGISRDITERIRWEEELRQSEEKYRLITENVADVITVYNMTKGQYVYISPSIQRLRGFTLEEAMIEEVTVSIVPESLHSFEEAMLKHMEEFISQPDSINHYTNDVQMFRKNGSRLWVEISTRFQYNAEGDIESVNIIRNIEERKKSEEDLRQLSYYDQLTGLYNRRYYEEELHRLDTHRNLPIALVMADLNGLKLTNDAFGHQEGDLLLKKIAKVIKKACRSDEIISRIGGDEFVILMPKTSLEDAKKIIERINHLVLEEEVEHGILSLSIGCSVKETISEKMHEVFRKSEDDMYRHKLSESSSMRSKTINLIMNSLYEKSSREMHHSKRVSMICKTLASVMGFNQEEINQAEIAGLVHDIGKIGINNNILDKTGKLSTTEWEEVKKHCEVGYRILSSVNEFSEISEYVLSHQERWDGTGYPQGLKGTAIPIQSRIIGVADAFDAMTSDRSYRQGMTEAEALSEVEKCAGTQFDPEIARLFIDQAIPLMNQTSTRDDANR